jgi:hypothetical protein
MILESRLPNQIVAASFKRNSSGLYTPAFRKGKELVNTETLPGDSVLYGADGRVLSIIDKETQETAPAVAPKKMASTFKNNAKSALVGIAMLVAAACGGSPPCPTCATPPTSSSATIKVYNATEGYLGTTLVTGQNGSITVNLSSIVSAVGASGLVTTEMALRYPSTSTSLGALKTAAGTSATITVDSDTFEAYIPSAKHNAPYSCIPISELNLGRDITASQYNIDGATGPWSVWQNAITNINNVIAPRKYGSLTYDPSSNGQITVGFGNDQHGSTAWQMAPNHCFLLGVGYPFKIGYSDPVTLDFAIEEIWERSFSIDDICGTNASSEVIGLAKQTNGAQWGLNDVGIDLTTRQYTRAR